MFGAWVWFVLGLDAKVRAGKTCCVGPKATRRAKPNPAHPPNPRSAGGGRQVNRWEIAGGQMGGGGGAVATRRRTLKGGATDLLELVRDKVDAERELHDAGGLVAEVKDADLGIGNTTVEPGLRVRLVLAVPVAAGRTATHDDCGEDGRWGWRNGFGQDRSKTEAIDTGSGGNGRGTSTPVSRRSLSIHYDGLNGYVQPRALPANTTQPRLGRQK